MWCKSAVFILSDCEFIFTLSIIRPKVDVVKKFYFSTRFRRRYLAGFLLGALSTRCQFEDCPLSCSAWQGNLLQTFSQGRHERLPYYMYPIWWQVISVEDRFTHKDEGDANHAKQACSSPKFSNALSNLARVWWGNWDKKWERVSYVAEKRRYDVLDAAS